MKSIICRTDSTKTPVVFLLDTLDSDKGTINIWIDFESNNEVESTLEYYKSTKAMTDLEETALAKKFVEKFGVKDGILLRRRLYWKAPDSAANANHMHDPEPVIAFDKDKFVGELVDAFLKALESQTQKIAA